MREWVRLLGHAARAEHIKLTEPLKDDLVRLGALLALVGTPEDREAQDVYYAFLALFMHTRRLGRWSLAIAEIPPDRAAVMRVAASARTYQRLVKGTGKRSLRSGNLKLDVVVKVMAALNAPEPYIKALLRDGFDLPGAIFHPNTFKQMEKSMRGALGTLGKRSREGHLDQVRSKVVITK